MRSLAIALAAFVLAAAASCGGGGPKPSPAEVAVIRVAAIPAGPDDAVWREAPLHTAPLLLQDLVEPRLAVVSTPQMRIQAATDGSRIAFRLSWNDGSSDDVVTPARFADACAVQLPAALDRDLPAPQMGEPGRSVEITYWRASWEAWVAGRPDDIHALYPNSATPHYPPEAASLTPGTPEQVAMANRYNPARALGNRMEGPRDRAVQDLVAEGPGTLHPAAEQRSTGSGRRGAEGWEVVLSRPLPRGLQAGGRSQMAVAVWQGAQGEVGARKMRSAWIPLAVEGQ